jgi:hypothetical protein
VNHPATALPALRLVTDEPVLTEHPARAWARSEGLPVAPTGRLPAHVIRAWREAGSPVVSLAAGDDVARRWAALLDEWSIVARAAGRRDSTIAMRRTQVTQFATHVGLDPTAVTRDHVTRWIGQPDLAPETRKNRRACLRVVYGWAYETGRLGHDPTARIPVCASASACRGPHPSRSSGTPSGRPTGGRTGTGTS